MRVGVSLRSSYGTDPRTGAAWMIERARAADAAGLDSLFVGDHHGTGPVPYYQNVPILGRLLAEWPAREAGSVPERTSGSVPERTSGSVPERISGSVPERISGALFLLPLWHPVLVAEQIATLASITPGRFVMQTAIGGGAPQFDTMGTPLAGRAARFGRALDAVRRLVAGEEVSDDDGACGYRFHRARIAPVTPEPLEVWIGATALTGIDRAARLGDAWLAPPEVLPSEAHDLAREYLARCADHERPPRAVAIRRDVHVGPDPASARAVAEPVIAGGYRGFRPDAFVVGSPDEVAGQLRELAAMGYTEVLVRQLAADQDDALRSIELLAEVRALVADA